MADHQEQKNSTTSSAKLSRRDMLKSSAALAATAAVSACGGGGSSSSASGGNKPNILFIMVDEMRFPKVFPQGVSIPAEYLQKFMPNVYRLWDGGVKFSNHHTAATACSPSRGVLLANCSVQLAISRPISANGIALSPIAVRKS
jgi:hypothetical protein